MIDKRPAEHQMSIFEVALESFIDLSHKLVLLSKQIEWSVVESDFAECYCADNGRPSVSIRTRVWMRRNCLKDVLVDAINTMMTAAAYNMRHPMSKNVLSPFDSWLLALVR